MTVPVMRFAVDWDSDLFLCYESRTTDALNRLHTGISSDTNLVNLHWHGVTTSGIDTATVSFQQEETLYGLRQFHVVTGTGTAAGAYFGRTGGTNIFNVTNGNTYTAVFWIKANVGTGVTFAFSMENSVGGQSVVVTGDWQKVTRTFTATSTTTAFKLIKVISATNVTFDATGFMIVDGSTAPNGFNVGNTSNLYDVMSPLDASWNSGSTKWADRMFGEGELTLSLDNEDKRYSPEYSSSPLFGSIMQRQRITVDIQTPGGTTCNPLWRGWTRPIEVKPGTNRNKQARLTAGQGKFILDELPFAPRFAGETYTIDEIITQIALRGFSSAATALQINLNRSRLNAAYYVDPDDILDLDTGLNDFVLYGEDWGQGDSNKSLRNSTRTLTDLNEVEMGWLYINRAGKLCFRNRTHYIDPATEPAAETISIDSDSVDFDYKFGTAYYNTVELTYRPKDTRVGIVWQTKADIVLGAKGSKETDVKFEYEEGRKLTVTEVNAFGDADPYSTFTATAGGATVNSSIFAQFTSEKNGRGKLILKNRSNQKVSVSVILRGTIVESYGGQIVNTVDEDGLTGGRIQLNKSTRLIDDADIALNLADYHLQIHKDPFGMFTSFTLDNKDDDRLNSIIDISIGTRVNISETQTAHAEEYVVIGERAEYRTNHLRMTYNLFPLFRVQDYWIIGQSVLGTHTYLGY